jgi:hypothetical protein
VRAGYQQAGKGGDTASGRKKAIDGGLHGAMPREYADRIAGRAALEDFMQRHSLMPGHSLNPRLSVIVATIALLSVPGGTVLAQTTPNAGAATTTAPAAAPPAATPPAASTTAAPAVKTETTTTEPAKPAKKQTAKKMTRQQEIDKSIDSGTVPARYRSSVPKEYHHLIPFDKR